MAEILTNNKNYLDIADTIRQMKNVNTTYKPREMASALKDIYSNEVEGTLPLSFEANGNNLLNYRIDGASGGVGERTSNLFDGILDFNKTLNPQGNSEGFDGRYCCHNSIDVSNISSCTISWKSKKNSALRAEDDRFSVDKIDNVSEEDNSEIGEEDGEYKKINDSSQQVDSLIE